MALLTTDRLSEIVMFMNKKPEVDAANFETLRHMTAELLESYTIKTEMGVGHLARYLAERGCMKNDGVTDDIRATMRNEKDELHVLHARRVR